jgi:hypothetical protein
VSFRRQAFDAEGSVDLGRQCRLPAPGVFNPDILQQDVQALKALYLNNGYTAFLWTPSPWK